MRGQILVFNEHKQAGAIVAADGQRLLFYISDWQDVLPPEAGMNVDFQPDSDSRARQVQLALPEPAAVATPIATPAASAVPFAQRPKHKPTLTLLALFLGGLGVHRFYMGVWGWGLVQLFVLLLIGILTALLPVLGWLLWFATTVFIMVETVRYILMSDTEFDAKVQAWQASQPGPFAFFW